MTHIYRLRAFAPKEGHLLWTCTACPRVVEQDRRTGTIPVIEACLEKVDHGGHDGAHAVFDIPERGAFEVGGAVGRFIKGL